jgi:hypothetical protein
VAATNNRDALASFSNFGANTVDLAAPGVNILSTLPRNLTSSGEPLSGKQVILEQRPVGTSGFSQVSDGVRTTDARGNFSLAGVAPAANTDYRAQFAGEGLAGLSPTTSLSRRVNVKALVSLSTAKLKLGGSEIISGSVSPAHTGSVRLVIKRNGQRLTTKTVISKNSAYSFSYKPPSTGIYTFSASFGGDTDHLGSRSVERSVKVVK